MLYIHLLYFMLTPFISSFIIEFANIFTAKIATGMSYYQASSSSLRTHNNKARGRSWNYPTAPGTPAGMDLDEVGGNRSQSGTPQEMSHSERASSGNNLTSAGFPFVNNLLNGLTTLRNPPSKEKLKAGWGGERTQPPESLPIIANNYRAQNQDEQKRVAWHLSAYISDNIRPDYHSHVHIYESPEKLR